MDITETLAPKSDQLNADDLIAGPITITITDVTKGNPEQPVNINWQGGDGRPYKPAKSMRRVIAQAWGVEANAYAGRSMTLYREPGVKYAGQDVGGIRISHMSHIEKPMKTAITLARGKREAYTVHPLTTPAPAPTRDLVAEGTVAAKNGVTAWRAWWATVPKSEQAAMKPHLAAWKATAESNDGGIENELS